jgi:hypothetical protein
MPENSGSRGKELSDKPTPEQFLAGFPLEIRSITQALRELVRAQVPHTREAVYPGWRLIGYRADHRDRNVYFAYIAPTADHVSLGFEWGILVPDPQGMLEGDGSQVRYARFRQLEDIRPAPLALLINQALEIAALPKDQKQQQLLDRDAEMDRLRGATD